MPTVKDKATGDVVSRQPYTAEGTQRAKTIVEANPDWEIDYAPGGTQNAPDVRESYQLGGQVPGQPGFGQRPSPIPNPYSYEEGGKVESIREARKEKRSRIKQAKKLQREGKFGKEFIRDMKATARKEKREKIKSIRKK